MPQISVIVPVYKVEPYLPRCVDSILEQTFTDFELILVNDGSPDNCGAICDEYASKDARVHVIHQANGGLSAARNAGIDWAFANSDSQWLAFVDSDDWVHPQYLELLYETARENNVKISICEFQRLYNEEPDPVQLNSKTVLLDWETLLIEHNLTAIVAWNKLYAKEVFIGLRYPVGKIHEDEFLTYKLLYCAKKSAYFQTALYYYYQNPNGIMGRAFSLKRLDAVDAYIERVYFTKKYGSRELFEHDLRVLSGLCTRKTDQMWKEESIPVDVKKEKECCYRREIRSIMLRCRVLPKKHRKLYYFAFPNCLSLARKTKSVFQAVFRR